MRTSDPTIVKSDFLRAIADVKASFQSVDAAPDPPVGNATKKLVAEMTLLSMGVLWEGFVSDLLVAYLNKDCTKLLATLGSRFEISTADDYAARAKSFMEVRSTKAHLKVGEIRKILNVATDNIPNVNDPDKLRTFAGVFLADPYSGYFKGLTKPQIALLKALRGARNYLAHRSSGAKERMSTSLARVDLHSDLRRGTNQVSDVGAYLLASPSGTRRILVFLDQVQALAAVLCP
jgi:hypothetical protein